MVIQSNIENKLGFDIIKKLIKEECITNSAKKLVDNICFSTNYEDIHKKLLQTEELKKILLFDRNFPSNDYYDLSEEIVRIKTQGTFIDQENLILLRNSLCTIIQIIEFLSSEENNYNYTELTKLSLSVIIDKQILNLINSILDEKGEIKDSASPKLLKIRKLLNQKILSVEKKLNQTINFARKEGWITEDISSTVRNGRVVIPVLATHKRKIKGFVHDVSSTGQTFYIEPEDVFDINNEIIELENEEKKEIIKILIDFTDFLRNYIDNLVEAYIFLIYIDFAMAKAKFAIKIKAVLPLLSEKSHIDWLDAFHPLLYLSHQGQAKKTIPLNIKLNEFERILVISGPNAGGKSVCLKTVGLIQYMLQCGILVPLRETSEVGVFTNIFIDIGDEQSIENDLSTYSSHLLNMKALISNATKSSLFLIDEFGSGTEPNLGGAIAESILEELSNRKSLGIVTTHYANLKLMGGKIDGIINGSMLFDLKTMNPLYKLKIGNPGSSFAFEIAQKIGLQPFVISKAKSKINKSQLDFEQQLQQLDVEKEQIKQKQKELEIADEFLSELIFKYQFLYQKLEKNKKIIIKHAKEEAIELINQSNKVIENAVRMIKESNAEKNATKQAREKIQNVKNAIIKSDNKTKIIKSETKNEKEIIGEQIFIGDFVKIIGQSTAGEVEAIKNEKATVLTNSVKICIPISRLQKISPKDFKNSITKTKSKQFSSIIDNINEKAVNFNPNLDLRGKRADEALILLKNMIDDAMLLSIYELRILHGKGNGILRQVVRDYLAGIDEVKDYRSEHIERGGDGITVVSLK